MKYYAFKYYCFGLCSFVFASRIGAAWKLVKSFFRSSDGPPISFVDDLSRYTIPIYQLLKLFSRTYPEYASVLWCILFAGLFVLVIYVASVRLAPSHRLKIKKYSVYLTVSVVVSSSVYLIGVDQTIKANPLLKLARESNTSVRVGYLFCGDDYGSYDLDNDVLKICSTAHSGDSSFHSRESTIRHEVWHIIQACSNAKRFGRWGNISPVGHPLLDNRELPEQFSTVLENYSSESQGYEREAFLAEIFLSDYLIEQEFIQQCHTTAS